MRLKLILSLQKLLGYCAALGDSCLLGRKVVLDPSFVVDVDFLYNETNVLTGALTVNFIFLVDVYVKVLKVTVDDFELFCCSPEVSFLVFVHVGNRVIRFVGVILYTD